MKYRLIKKYPGFDVLGTYSKDHQGLVCSTYLPNGDFHKYASANEIMDSPEFWEKVITDKIAVRLKDEREMAVLMKHYSEKGWESFDSEEPETVTLESFAYKENMVSYENEFVCPSHATVNKNGRNRNTKYDPNWYDHIYSLKELSDILGLGLEIPVAIGHFEDGEPIFMGSKVYCVKEDGGVFNPGEYTNLVDGRKDMCYFFFEAGCSQAHAKKCGSLWFSSLEAAETYISDLLLKEKLAEINANLEKAERLYPKGVTIRGCLSGWEFESTGKFITERDPNHSLFGCIWMDEYGRNGMVYEAQNDLWSLKEIYKDSTGKPVFIGDDIHRVNKLNWKIMNLNAAPWDIQDKDFVYFSGSDSKERAGEFINQECPVFNLKDLRAAITGDISYFENIAKSRIKELNDK